jgi:hypothetical protein
MSLDICDMAVRLYIIKAKLHYFFRIALNVPANRLLVTYTKAIIMTANATAPALLL